MRVTAGKSTTMLIMLGVLIGAFACAPRVVPPPNAVRRIAVLPPGGPLGGRGTSVTTYGVTVESLGDVLASAARDEIARRGFQVLDPGLVETASGGRVRASPEMAAEIIASAQLDATALFIRVRRWEFAYPTLRTNEVIASLDAVLVDPTTSKVAWETPPPGQTGPAPRRARWGSGERGRRSGADARSLRITRVATPRVRYRATACWQACRCGRRGARRAPLTGARYHPLAARGGLRVRNGVLNEGTLLAGGASTSGCAEDPSKIRMTV